MNKPKKCQNVSRLCVLLPDIGQMESGPKDGKKNLKFLKMNLKRFAFTYLYIKFCDFH